MVPVRAEFGSEYSKNAASSVAELPARPHLVLCDVSQVPERSAPTRRRRSRHGWQRSLLGFAVACAVLFLIATCVAALWHNAVVAYAGVSRLPDPVVSVRVNKGDTLWRYAARYGDPGTYMPDRVQSLADANHLPLSTPLVPGQTLRIPVQNPVELARLNLPSHARVASRLIR